MVNGVLETRSYRKDDSGETSVQKFGKQGIGIRSQDVERPPIFAPPVIAVRKDGSLAYKITRICVVYPELPAWRDDTAFHQLLASFGSTLPLRRASALREARMRKRILHLTEGVTVRVCRLLEEAAVQAIASGGERIELETLSEEVVTASLISISDRRTRRTAA